MLGLKLSPIPNKCVIFDCNYDYLCNFGMVWHLESERSYTVQWKFSFIEFPENKNERGRF
jgi:hypothetical protein